MGILTWIFIDGHGSGLLNFTPTPLMVVIIALVVAVGYGLATDYEVFLVSRMVEARENGMSTAGSHPNRHGDHRSPHHRRGPGACRGRRFLRVLRPGDDEVSGIRADGGAAAGRHRGPDVPGAVGDEVARRRLLVGPALDEATAEPDRPGRNPIARRAQAAGEQGATSRYGGSGRRHPATAARPDTPGGTRACPPGRQAGTRACPERADRRESGSGPCRRAGEPIAGAAHGPPQGAWLPRPAGAQ